MRLCVRHLGQVDAATQSTGAAVQEAMLYADCEHGLKEVVAVRRRCALRGAGDRPTAPRGFVSCHSELSLAPRPIKAGAIYRGFHTQREFTLKGSSMRFAPDALGRAQRR